MRVCDIISSQLDTEYDVYLYLFFMEEIIMACFIVPATEAVVTTVAGKALKNRGESVVATKLAGLSKLLWGGSALLAFEHVWHGEVTPFFPFLTAAENAEDLAEMLHEMSTVGVSMAIIVTMVWGISTIANIVMDKMEENKKCVY